MGKYYGRLETLFVTILILLIFIECKPNNNAASIYGEATAAQAIIGAILKHAACVPCKPIEIHIK